MLMKAIESGKEGKAQIAKDSVQSLNRLGKMLELENDKVEELKVMRSELDKVQRDHIVPAEIPRSEIEHNYKAVPGSATKPEAEKEPIDARRLALVARAHVGLSVVDTPLATTRGVDKYGVRDGTSVIDLTGKMTLSYKEKHTKASSKK